jgi:hypothetical protein
MKCPACGNPIPTEYDTCPQCGAGGSDTVQPAGTGKRLALIAVGLCVLAVFVNLGLPALLENMERRKQYRTMSYMRSIGTAVESYGVDNGFIPNAASVHDLIPVLQPTYIRILPVRDTWGTEFRYQVWQERPKKPYPDSYGIASAGKDGSWERMHLRNYKSGVMTDPKNDILYCNGQFVVWPEGTSR